VTEILDIFCRPGLKANYVSKAGYASVFRWNKETGDYIKFGPHRNNLYAGIENRDRDKGCKTAHISRFCSFRLPPEKEEEKKSPKRSGLLTRTIKDVHSLSHNSDHIP